MSIPQMVCIPQYVPTFAKSLTNKSGSTVNAGDVVALSSSTTEAFTSEAVLGGYIEKGVAMETIANNAAGLIAFSGYVAAIQVSGSVAIGDRLQTSGTAFKAQTQSDNTLPGIFALATSAGTNTTVSALLFGRTEPNLASHGNAFHTAPATPATVTNTAATGSDNKVPHSDHVHAYGDTWTTFTPTLAQNGARTITVNTARHSIQGKFVTVVIYLTITNAGTAGNAIRLTLPAALTAAYQDRVIGTVGYSDVGVGLYHGFAYLASTTIVDCYTHNSGAALGAAGPSFAVANTDAIWYNLTYELA